MCSSNPGIRVMVLLSSIVCFDMLQAVNVHVMTLSKVAIFYMIKNGMKFKLLIQQW